MIRLVFTIIAGVLLGGVVHLVSVLALPRIATIGERLKSPISREYWPMPKIDKPPSRSPVID